MADTDAVSAWSAQQAESLYAMETWGDGFFHVNEAGHVAVRPRPGSDLTIDIPEVIAAAQEEGMTMPLIIRFQDVLRARVRRLNEAFAQAIAESGYSNRYQGVYPIKVNQLHEVVDEVLDAGEPFGMGLECGSKTELVAALRAEIEEYEAKEARQAQAATLARLTWRVI